jgi:hypothetical protein
MAEYDPNIIRQFADEMYRRADSILGMYVVIGALIGLIAGWMLGGILGAMIGGGIAGWIGYTMGTQKAFALKLEAQVALCQVAIAENTQTIR